jgi:hypothetical protein
MIGIGSLLTTHMTCEKSHDFLQPPSEPNSKGSKLMHEPGGAAVGPCLTDEAHKAAPGLAVRGWKPLRLGPNTNQGDHCGALRRWFHVLLVRILLEVRTSARKPTY